MKKTTIDSKDFENIDKDLLYLRLEKKELECLNRKTMTRKEQIYATSETFLEDNDIGKMTFPSELSAELADRIFALPIEVPGDEEIEIKYSTSLPVLCCLHDIPIKFDAEQGGFLSHMRDNNDLKQRGAKWMRSEIIKRNRP